MAFGGLVALLGLAAERDAWAQEVPFNLEAGQLNYNLNDGIITATNGVRITGQDGQLEADRMTYTVSTDVILAEGHVIYVDTQSNTLLVDKLQLSGQMQRGVADKLRLSMPDLGEVVRATSATKVNNTLYTMDNVVYSPCKTCIGDEKPWQIKASKVDYNREKQNLIYHHARLEVYGVPVVYLPYFSHPVGPKHPRNGVLFPQFGTSSANGAELKLGAYYYDPNSNADYTVRSRIMTDRGTQMMLERRQEGKDTSSKIGGSILDDSLTGTTRSHGLVVAEKVLNVGERIGINAEVASDDSYMNEFFDRTDAYLDSTAYYEKADLNKYMLLNSTWYQDLDTTRPAAQTAQVLPHFQYEQLYPMAWPGSQLMWSTDVINLSRREGTEYQRLISSLDYALPYMLADGSRMTFGTTLRGDIYQVHGTSSDGTQGRVLPEATLKWEKPYMSPNGTHIVTPIVFGAISPKSGNPSDIPNEDSVAYELDFSNLFEPSRFAGYDRVETGPRLVYGVDNRWGTPDYLRWRLFLGQGIRTFTDDNLPNAGGASDIISDWIGYAEANPNKWLGFSQSFRLDNSSLAPQRVDTSARLGDVDSIHLFFGHTYLRDGAEELWSQLTTPINDNWKFVGEIRRDMDEERLLLGEGKLIWTRDCYELSFIARRRGYETDTLPPSTDYLVNVNLLTLGGAN